MLVLKLSCEISQSECVFQVGNYFPVYIFFLNIILLFDIAWLISLG
ncbi:hypothetical protein CIT292_10209 [Citrobacter youngae ATCC 29220]|uniref:Uncharacterized protein n=1 Tax=Citrobacter youngae ATCC 29220 TaxID=500640 RepID=D4BI45_9ENTR|nr:hypothetical protein CIT292_10209 [Citrobacter youngae ATCC 29220]